MPIIDKTVTLPAIPERIGDYLLFKTPANAKVDTVKENTLYVLTQDGIGLVFLIRAAPDAGKSMVRLIGDRAETIQSAFAAGNPKEALQKIIATPAEPRPELLPKIAGHIAALDRAFPSRVLATLPPDDDNPFAAAAAEAESGAAPAIGGVTPPRPARRNNSGIIIGIVAVVVFFGVCAIAGLAFRQITNQTGGSQSTFNGDVQLNYDSSWESFSTAMVPECSGLATLGFTCYVALRTEEDAVELLLGGVPSKRSVDLGQVEKDSLEGLQMRNPATQRLRTYYMKLSPKKIDAIRREMVIPVRNTDLTRYVSQLYFQYNGVLYELTVMGSNKEVFDANAAKIDSLIKGITFK